MASINSLQLKGIRSFDPDQESVIHFYSPLTLIVGHNGTGKTTIIEALKYATTGELPPNSKAGAFIFDPKIAKRNEVIAQIKLGFTSLDGDNKECLRSMLLTQKKTNVTQKTLESVLYHFDKESRLPTSHTSRSSNLDVDMQLYLGVSKSILDNVIFCHQEESNWPLSEPSILKKKFDDIFSATQHTKALENIKNIIKEKKANQKLYDVELKHTDEKRRKYLKLETESETIRVQVKESDNLIQGLNKNLRDVKINIQYYKDKIQKNQSLIDNIKYIEQEIDFIKKSIEDLKGNMKFIDKPKSELVLQAQEEKGRLSIHQDRLNELTSEQKKDIEKQNLLQDEFISLKTNEGKFESENDIYQKQLNERSLLLSKIKDILTEQNEISQTSFVDEDEMTITLSEALERSIGQIQLNLTELKEECRKKEQEINSELQKLREQYAKFQDDASSCTKNIEISKQKIEENKKILLGFEQEHNEYLKLKEKIAEKEKDLKTLSSTIGSCTVAKTIEAKSQELAKLEAELFDNSIPATVPNSTIDRQAMLRSKDITRIDLEEQLKSLKEVNSKHFQKYLGRIPAPKDAQRHMDFVLSIKKKDAQALEKVYIDSLKNQLSSEAQLELLKSQKSRKDIELQENNKECRLLCGNLDYLCTKETCEMDVEMIESKINEIKGSAKLMCQLIPNIDKLSKEALLEKGCPICLNETITESNFTLFKKILDQYFKNQIELVQLEKDLYPKMTKLNDLLKFAPTWERMESIKTQIPELEREIGIQEINIDHYKSQVNHFKQKIEGVQADIEASLQLMLVAKEMKRIEDRLDLINSEISNLSKADHPIPDISYSSNSLLTQIKSLREEIEELKTGQSKQAAEHLNLEKELQSLISLTQAHEIKIQQKQILVDTVNSLENQILDLGIRKEACEKKMKKLKPLIDDKLSEISVAHEVLDTMEADLHRKLNLNRQYYNDLKHVQDSINISNVKDPGNKLLDSIRCIKECELKIETIKKEIQARSETIAELNNRIHNTESFQRNIADNLKYLELMEELQAKELEIQKVRSKYNEEEVDEDNFQLNKLKDDETTLAHKSARLDGEIRQLEAQLIKINSEISTNYTNALEEHRLQVSTCLLNDLSIKDLELHAKSLDSAIIKYHSLKMMEINKTIKDLWTETYYGTDIEAIKIRSDTENTRGGRSYNYKVVMVKDGVELDMRGRCSAGQKVLTSIIIRLALAEAFGSNCGILALDEPTTNLDRDNIKSLAESLSGIIESRRKQSNFQLVIITHDEEFTAYLGHSGYTDWYWVVSKDESNRSTISKRDIKYLY